MDDVFAKYGYFFKEMFLVIWLTGGTLTFLIGLLQMELWRCLIVAVEYRDGLDESKNVSLTHNDRSNKFKIG